MYNFEHNIKNKMKIILKITLQYRFVTPFFDKL